MKRHITTTHIKDTSVKEPIQISNDEIEFDLNYVLNAEKSIEKKLECYNRPPVTVLTKTREGKEKVNHGYMTIEFNLGLFEYMKENLTKELKKRFEVDVTTKKVVKVQARMFKEALAEVHGAVEYNVQNRDQHRGLVMIMLVRSFLNLVT